MSIDPAELGHFLFMEEEQGKQKVFSEEESDEEEGKRYGNNGNKGMPYLR